MQIFENAVTGQAGMPVHHIGDGNNLHPLPAGIPCEFQRLGQIYVYLDGLLGWRPGSESISVAGLEP